MPCRYVAPARQKKFGARRLAASKFESYMPSHAVGLLQVRSPAIGTNVRSALGGD
jgi:hypothetical protein